MQSGKSIYDGWISDSDLIGTHYRYGKILALTDYMDRTAIDALGAKPLVPLFQRIDAIASVKESAAFMRLEMDAYAWVPFASAPARCARNMALLLSTRLSLPDTLARLQQQGRVARPL